KFDCKLFRKISVSLYKVVSIIRPYPLKFQHFLRVLLSYSSRNVQGRGQTRRRFRRSAEEILRKIGVFIEISIVSSDREPRFRLSFFAGAAITKLTMPVTRLSQIGDWSCPYNGVK